MEPLLCEGQKAEWVLLSGSLTEGRYNATTRWRQEQSDEVDALIRQADVSRHILCAGPDCEKMLGEGDRVLVVFWRNARLGGVERKLVFCSVECQRRNRVNQSAEFTRTREESGGALKF